MFQDADGSWHGFGVIDWPGAADGVNMVRELLNVCKRSCPKSNIHTRKEIYILLDPLPCGSVMFRGVAMGRASMIALLQLL
jgi:hypothetical protein